jgi:hypothetical protein
VIGVIKQTASSKRKKVRKRKKEEVKGNGKESL